MGVRPSVYIPLAAAAIALAGVAAVPEIFPVLQSTVRIGKQPAGFYLLPTNQLLQPWGEQATMKGRPVDAALDPSKRIFAVLNRSGIDFFNAGTSTPLGTAKTKPSSYTGIAFRPGVTGPASELWSSETARNGPDFVLITPVSETGIPGKAIEIALEKHPVPCRNCVLRGRRPRLCRDEPLQHPGRLRRRNSQADEGDPGRDCTFRCRVFDEAPRHLCFQSRRTPAPGFGNHCAHQRFCGTDRSCHWHRDLRNASVSSTTDTLALREIKVGRAPSGIALSPDESMLAVANGHSDSISVLDTETSKRTEVKIPAYPEGVTGQPADRRGVCDRWKNTLRSLRRHQRNRGAATTTARSGMSPAPFRPAGFRLRSASWTMVRYA